MSALSFTAAHQALARGCELLHKPRELATELVRFLIVKRWHDMEPYGMSLGAGADVEGLWHWMLLNTQVSTCHARTHGYSSITACNRHHLSADSKDSSRSSRRRGVAQHAGRER